MNTSYSVQPNTFSSKVAVESHRRAWYMPGCTTRGGPLLTSHSRTLPSMHILDGPSIHDTGRETAPQ